MKEIVVIVGGGIAGLEAAAQLLKLGYSPIIIEKSDHLGGHVADWHMLFPDMTPASEIVSGLVSGSKDANVFLSTEISFINRLKDSYNIMLSNGISIITKYILVTTGFRLFEAEKKEEYGYGVYDQVITNADLEKWFNNHKDKRIDNSDMKAIGFVHCVGSRDEKVRNSQCSKVPTSRADSIMNTSRVKELCVTTVGLPTLSLSIWAQTIPADLRPTMSFLLPQKTLFQRFAHVIPKRKLFGCTVL